MKNFKVPHDAEGNHQPTEPESTTVYTEPYELKQAGLKFVYIDIGRGGTTFVVWEDMATGKQYRSAVYLLSEVLTTDIKEIKRVFADGLRIYGDFEFEQRGQHVLLTVKEEEEVYVPDTNTIIDYAAEFCRRFLEKELTPGELKKEMRFFIKAVNDRKGADNNG